MASLNRRDFLTFKSDRRLDISCERLFMLCANSGATQTLPQAGGAGDARDNDAQSLREWGTLQHAEPPTDYDGPSLREVIASIERDLREVDVVRLSGTQWLHGELCTELDRVLAAFRARGGRCEAET